MDRRRADQRTTSRKGKSPSGDFPYRLYPRRPVRGERGVVGHVRSRHPRKEKTMSKKNKGPQTDHAVPTIRQPKERDADKVALTTQLHQSVMASPDWAQATAVQTALAGLDGEAQNLAAILAQI